MTKILNDLFDLNCMPLVTRFEHLITLRYWSRIRPVKQSFNLNIIKFIYKLFFKKFFYGPKKFFMIFEKVFMVQKSFL